MNPRMGSGVRCCPEFLCPSGHALPGVEIRQPRTSALEATLLQWGHALPSVEMPYIPVSPNITMPMLQWGHALPGVEIRRPCPWASRESGSFNGATPLPGVEIRPVPDLVAGVPLASMGPRPSRRGDHGRVVALERLGVASMDALPGVEMSPNVAVPINEQLLQWGHAPSGRGDWGLLVTLVYTIYALQCGHAPSGVEISRLDRLRLLRLGASMGPRPSRRGDKFGIDQTTPGTTLQMGPHPSWRGDVRFCALCWLPTIDNASYQTRRVGVNDRNFPTVCRVAWKTAMIPGAAAIAGDASKLATASLVSGRFHRAQRIGGE